MWGVFTLPGPCRQYKNLGILLNQYQVPLYYMKHYAKSLKEGFNFYQCIVHTLKF